LRKSAKERDEEKKFEKQWGNDISQKYFNSNEYTGQWTTRVGEGLVKVVLQSKGFDVWNPEKKNGHKLDWETNKFMIEVKSRTYTTTGTAGEKILGVPLKYCDVPEIFNKPVKIIVVGFEEKEAEHKFCLFGNCSDKKQTLINYYKELGFEYIRLSDILTDKVTL
jgi:hypothetical protein